MGAPREFAGVRQAPRGSCMDRKGVKSCAAVATAVAVAGKGAIKNIFGGLDFDSP